MVLEPKEIELSYVTMRYEKPIIHLVFKEGAELGSPEIRELTSSAEKLSAHNNEHSNIRLTNDEQTAHTGFRSVVRPESYREFDYSVVLYFLIYTLPRQTRQKQCIKNV